MITPDKNHPPLLFDFSLTLTDIVSPSIAMVLYNILGHSGWFCVPKENSAESVVNDLSAIKLEAINLAISYIKSKNST